MFAGIFAILVSMYSLASIQLEDKPTSSDSSLRLEDYKKGLERLESLSKQMEVSGDFTSNSDRFDSNKQPFVDRREEKLRFASDGMQELYSFTSMRHGYFERVVVASENEKFVLRRENPKHTLFLEFAQMPEAALKGLHTSQNLTIHSMFRAAGFKIIDMLKSKSFRLVRLDEEKPGIFRIEFQVNMAVRVDRPMSGWLLVDSHNAWALDGYRINSDYVIDKNHIVARFTGEFEYEKRGEFPVPKRIHLLTDRTTNDRRANVDDTFTVTRWSYTKPDPAQFSLSYYKLKEDVSPPVQQNNSFFTWLIGFAVGSILLALVCLGISRALRRRETNRS